MSDENPNITLKVRNYRCLRVVEWEIPQGLSALVGPNGAGKSTLLSVFAFLKTFVVRDLGAAVQGTGGAYGLKHFDTTLEEFVEFELSLGELLWKVTLPLEQGGVSSWVGERMELPNQPFVVHPLLSPKGTVAGKDFEFKPHQSALLDSAVQELLREQKYVRLFHAYLGLWVARAQHRRALSYDLSYLRRGGSPVDSEATLSDDGRNVWSVLRNWRDKRETRDRWEFVLRGMRRAFGNLFDDLDFEFTAQQVSARIYVPGRKESIPHHLFSDGWFTGLLHLCAVASAEKGSLLSIDEPENSLHPHAIRSLMESFAEWADEHQLSIILATHSPVVLNQIKDRSRVFIMEPGHPTLPVSLDAHPNREWLEHFSIGDAYANEEVGAPAPREP